MSDDELIGELKDDLSREREKQFLFKHKYTISTIIAVILIGVAGNEFYKSYKNDAFKTAAIDYNQYTDTIRNLEQDQKEKNDVSLKSDSLKHVPAYLSMVYLTKLNEAKKIEASDQEQLEILKEYQTKSKNIKPTIHDSLLQLDYLSLQLNDKKIAEIEPEYQTYFSHPFALKDVAYEFILLAALKENNQDIAKKYYTLLEQDATSEMQKRLKIYSTHRLLANLVDAKKENNDPKDIKKDHDKPSVKEKS